MTALILTLSAILLATVGMIFAVWRIALYFSTASDEHDAKGDDASVKETNVPTTQYAKGYVFSEVPHTSTSQRHRTK